MTEDDLKESWDIYWYWEWIINSEWPMSKILKSYATIATEHLAPSLKKFGVQTILDVTCGFGLKSVLLLRKGFQVSGSDISSVAVERANELAKREKVTLEFRESPWSQVAEVWSKEQFDCVFCDALSWTPNEEILIQACANFSEVLKNNGILVWAGAPINEEGRDSERLALEAYRSKPAFLVQGPWTLQDGKHVTRIICRELDGEGVFVHRIYVVTYGASDEIQVSSLPEPACWSWNRMWRILKSAGFSSSETIETRVNGENRLHNVTRK